MRDADAVFTLRPYYRRRSGPLKQAEEKGIPIYVLRNNTTQQMERQLLALRGEGDVSDPTFAPVAVAKAVELGGRLDTLVNSAGILRFANSHEVDLATWNQILNVNLTGTFLLCQAAIPAMVDAGGGAIVNIASTAALAGHPWAAAYSASKGGVLALTRTLAVEYARRGIRCNAVCPGSIQTPITDEFHLPEGADGKLLHRIMAITGMAPPSVIAAAVAYLGSDDAFHVNGTDLRVDGATHS